MGACSSKPKTKESEGSMEPHKPTDDLADAPKHTERSLDKVADSHEKDVPANSREEGQASTASAVQTAPRPDEQLPSTLSSSTAEGAAELPSDVIGEKEPVCKPVSDEVYQKERNGDGISDETLKKDDVGGGGIADNACESEGKGVKLADEAKSCEDKKVVSEESGGKQEDGVYVDKTVALDEAISPRTPGERNIIVPAGEAMDCTDCAADVESPIIGVVKHADSIGDAVVVDGGKKMDDAIDIDGGRKMEDAIDLDGRKKMDDAIDIDGGTIYSAANPVKDCALDDANTDIREVAENTDSGLLNAEVGLNRPDHAENYAVQGEIPLPAGSVEPVCSSAEAARFQDSQHEIASQSQGAKTGVDVSHSTTVDSNEMAAECSKDMKLDSSRKEREINHYDHPHGDKRIDEVGVDNSMASENASSDGSAMKPGTEDSFEGIDDGEIKPVAEGVDARNGQMQLLSKETDGDGSKTGERELNMETGSGQISASKPEVEKQTSERRCVEHTPSNDPGFENVGDRLDPNKSMESTQLAI